MLIERILWSLSSATLVRLCTNPSVSPTPSRIVFSTSWSPSARWRLSSRPARPGPGFLISFKDPVSTFVLAHAKRLRAIADSTYKRDEVDAELLARMRLAGLIPEVHPKSVERFSKPAHLVSYAGLAPRTSQSGLRPVRHGSIPAGANRWLRGAFVCAVVTHIAHAPDSWLSHAYEQTRDRLGWQVARVATARRLARAVQAMLRTGEVWHGESTTYREKSELQESHVALTTPRFD